jgi:hypothetical protein
LVIGPFSRSEYLVQQIKLIFPPRFRSEIVNPTDIPGLLVKGALAAGIEECRSIKNAVIPGPSAPGPGEASLSFYLTDSYLLQIPHETNSSFHIESSSCNGHHDPDGKDRIYDSCVVVLTKGQCMDQFTQLRFPVVQFFTSGHPQIFYHFMRIHGHQMLLGNVYSDANSCK